MSFSPTPSSSIKPTRTDSDDLASIIIAVLLIFAALSLFLCLLLICRSLYKKDDKGVGVEIELPHAPDSLSTVGPTPSLQTKSLVVRELTSASSSKPGPSHEEEETLPATLDP